MMSFLGYSLICNIYKTRMSHQCRLKRERNSNASSGSLVKDVAINHQAVTGSVRDARRGRRGLAIGNMTARCVNSALGNQTDSRGSSSVQNHLCFVCASYFPWLPSAWT